MTLTGRFLETCDAHPRRVAIVDDSGPIIYYDLALASKKVTALLNNNDASGQHIGILLPSSKEFVASCFGILFAGKTPVPLNPLCSPAQLSYIIQDANLNTILTLSAFEKILINQAINPVYLDKVSNQSDVGGVESYTGNDDDLAAIFYTSGTTANPKGVMLTHKNIISNLQGCVPRFHFTEHEVILGALPLFHTLAFTTTLALPLYFGATIVYLGRFSGPRALDAIRKHKVTFVVAVPSMYRVLLRTIKSPPSPKERGKGEGTGKYDISSVRLCTTGGEPVPKDLIESFNSVFSFPLIEGYGLTEASPVVSVNSPEDNKPYTAGKPLSNLQVRIVDDGGNDLPANKDGEIWVKGPNVMKGYHNMPEETRRAITPDGWLKSGDIGRLDEEGFLKIAGRKKELIIISGENVSPYEIEEVLSQHPKVFEVAVVGVPDEVRGEVPKAFVSLHEYATPPAMALICHPERSEGSPAEILRSAQNDKRRAQNDTEAVEEELRKFCKGKLPPYKIPRYFEFRKELPHGSTGKVLKRAL